MRMRKGLLWSGIEGCEMRFGKEVVSQWGGSRFGRGGVSRKEWLLARKALNRPRI